MLLFLSTVYASSYMTICGQRGTTQLELNSCAAESYNLADKELNMLYQNLKKQLPSESFSTLKSKQIQWIKTRDATCVRPSSGSMAPMVEYGCKATETEKRNEELRKLIFANDGTVQKSACCTIYGGQWDASLGNDYQCSFWTREGDIDLWKAMQAEYTECVGKTVKMACLSGSGQVDCF